jgi:hypothetical protein
MVPMHEKEANLNSALVICWFSIGLDFKLVVVDKGSPSLWVSRLLLELTKT